MHGCNCSCKKSPSMKKWMVKVILQKKSVWSKKMNGRSLLLSSNKMTHYFKEWTTPGGVLKKHILFLQKFDGTNTSSLTVAFPKNYSSPKENQGYKHSERL